MIIEQTFNAYEIDDKKLVNERIIDYKDIFNNKDFRIHFEIYDNDEGTYELIVHCYKDNDYANGICNDVFKFDTESETGDELQRIIEEGRYIPDWWLDSCDLEYCEWVNSLTQLLNRDVKDKCSEYYGTNLGNTTIIQINFKVEVDNLTENEIKLLTEKGYKVY